MLRFLLDVVAQIHLDLDPRGLGVLFLAQLIVQTVDHVADVALAQFAAFLPFPLDLCQRFLRDLQLHGQSLDLFCQPQHFRIERGEFLEQLVGL